MRKRLKAEEGREAAKSQSGEAPGSGTMSLMAKWLRRHVLGETPLPQLRPEQRAILAATRREERLDELLGLPTRPPAAPSGVGRAKGCRICTLGRTPSCRACARLAVCSTLEQADRVFIFPSNTSWHVVTSRPVHLWGCWQREEPAGWLVLPAH